MTKRRIGFLKLAFFGFIAISIFNAVTSKTEPAVPISNTNLRVTAPAADESPSGNRTTFPARSVKVEEAPPPTPLRRLYVTADRLNVRSGPSTQHTIISKVTQNSAVRPVRNSNDWTQIELGNGQLGWVAARYLSTSKVAASKPKPPQQTLVSANTLSRGEVVKRIIAQSIRSYSGNCPCPYNTTKRGRQCGGRSAYSRPGGASPLCYPNDVTNRMVSQYLARQ